MLESFQEGFLNYLLSIFAVVHEVLSDPQELSIVSLHKLLESRDIAMLAGMNERQVIVCSFGDCKLCRILAHCFSHFCRVEWPDLIEPASWAVDDNGTDRANSSGHEFVADSVNSPKVNRFGRVVFQFLA
jgi:hypothetical protein